MIFHHLYSYMYEYYSYNIIYQIYFPILICFNLPYTSHHVPRTLYSELRRYQCPDYDLWCLSDHRLWAFLLDALSSRSQISDQYFVSHDQPLIVFLGDFFCFSTCPCPSLYVASDQVCFFDRISCAELFLDVRFLF